MKTICKQITGLTLALGASLFLVHTNASAQVLTVLNPGFSLNANLYNPSDWTSTPSGIAFSQRNGQYATFTGADPSGYFSSLSSGTLSQGLGSQLAGVNLGTFTFSSSLAANGNGHDVNASDSLKLEIYDNTTSLFIGTTTVTGNELSPSAFGTYSVTSSLVNKSDSITIEYVASTPTAGHEFAITDAAASFTAAAVPEPSTWALLLGGLGCLLVWKRARREA